MFVEHQLGSTERARVLCDLDEVFVRLADLYNIFETLHQREEATSTTSDDGLRLLRDRQEEIVVVAQVLTRTQLRALLTSLIAFGSSGMVCPESVATTRTHCTRPLFKVGSVLRSTQE